MLLLLYVIFAYYVILLMDYFMWILRATLRSWKREFVDEESWVVSTGEGIWEPWISETVIMGTMDTGEYLYTPGSKFHKLNGSHFE